MGEWLKQLAAYGDPIEIEGYNYEIGTNFPRYAEVWGEYVLPNRDPNDHSKFREGFPVELEDIFNSHYGIWYHLTVSYKQLSKLQDSPLDMGDPLFHLATATELVQRIFIQLYSIQDEKIRALLDEKLSEEDAKTLFNNYWKNEYDRQFEDWLEKRKPVHIPLHPTAKLHKELDKSIEGYNNFQL